MDLMRGNLGAIDLMTSPQSAAEKLDRSNMNEMAGQRQLKLNNSNRMIKNIDQSANKQDQYVGFRENEARSRSGSGPGAYLGQRTPGQPAGARNQGHIITTPGLNNRTRQDFNSKFSQIRNDEGGRGRAVEGLMEDMAAQSTQQALKSTDIAKKIRQSLALGNSLLSSNNLGENASTIGTSVAFGAPNQASVGRGRSFSTIQIGNGRSPNFCEPVDGSTAGMNRASRGFLAQNLGPTRIPTMNNYSTIIHQRNMHNNQGTTNERLDPQKFGTVNYEGLALHGPANDFTAINKASDLSQNRLSSKPRLLQTNNYMASTQAKGRNPILENDLAALGCGGELFFERTAKSTRNVQQVEREWLDRLQAEKARHRTRERESKQQISRLTNDLKQEQNNLTKELHKVSDVKKNNQDLRKKLSELVVRKSQLKKQNEAYQVQTASQQAQIEQLSSQLQLVEAQQQQTLEKLRRKQIKHGDEVGYLSQQHRREAHELKSQIERLGQQNRENEKRLNQRRGKGGLQINKKGPEQVPNGRHEGGIDGSYDQDEVNLADQPEYDDRVRQLLADLEQQSKAHIAEVNKIHEEYRYYVIRSKEMEERCKAYQADAEAAIQGERLMRRELKKLNLQNEALLKRMAASRRPKNQKDGRPPKPSSQTYKNTDDAVGESDKDEEYQRLGDLMPSELKQLKAKVNSSSRRGAASHPGVAGHGLRNLKDQESKKKQLFSNMGSIQVYDGGDDIYRDDTSRGFGDSALPSNKSGQSKENGSQRRGSRHSTERQVLSRICDNIHQNQTCLNGRIRRMFSLQSVLMSPTHHGQFLEKRVMMDQLGEYENLIRAIGALQYTSRYMAHVVPVVFRAWKEMAFERRANRIHDMLSSQGDSYKDAGQADGRRTKSQAALDAANRFQDVEDDDGLIEADDDYEEYFFRDQGEDEQYVKVVEDNRMMSGMSGAALSNGDLPDQSLGGMINQTLNCNLSQQSRHILPMDSSNFYHDHNKYNIKGKLDHSSSDYTEDQAISIQEDKEDDEDANSRGGSPNQRNQRLRSGALQKSGMGADGSPREDDPEVENAKLLLKHARQPGMDPTEMLFGNHSDYARNEDHEESPQDEQDRLDRNAQEEIMTKEDYIDDVEEETAQLLIDRKFNQLDDPVRARGCDFGQANKQLDFKAGKNHKDPKDDYLDVAADDDDSDYSQRELIQGPDGNLYFQDADGNVVLYELPSDEQIEPEMQDLIDEMPRAARPRSR